jgi:hypothetical protein
MENNISFSKIVATPTLNSWSQAYNAGKFFAVLSLEKTQELNQDIESLNILGKDLLERLEQEFFTIEDKNLESIKTAISNTFQKETQGVNFSFAAGAFIGNILYLFTLGKAKAFIKRGGNFGKVLESQTYDLKEIISSSGFLKEEDLIVLATEAFSEVVADDELNLNINSNSPEEIAESLAPKIHKAENGKISAIIVKYGNPKDEDNPVEAIEAREENDADLEEEISDEKPISSSNNYLSRLLSKIKRPNINFNPRRKIFLIAAVVIAAILIFSIFMTIQKQNDAKVKALFDSVYPQASKKYEEGQSLLDLNKSLARDSFISAQKILQDNKDKFPAKSKEATQMQDLLGKVETGLAQISPIDSSGLDRSKLSVAVQNGSGTEGVAGVAAELLKELGYNVPTIENADNYNYQGVTIEVKNSKREFVDLLKKDLSKNYTISSTTSDLSSDSPTDAVVIIGK